MPHPTNLAHRGGRMMTDTETDLSFALTPADALAWEAQPQALRGARLFAYYLWLAAGAGWLLRLPAHWITGQLGRLLLLLLLVAVQIALASLAMSLAARRRARRRVPAPIAAGLPNGAPLSSGSSAPPPRKRLTRQRSGRCASPPATCSSTRRPPW